MEQYKIIPCTNGVGEWEISPIHETFDTRQQAEERLKELQLNFSIEELRHIFDAVEQHIYATEERIKDNYAFDQHSDTHICERNLGELNDLRGKILINIKGGHNA